MRITFGVIFLAIIYPTRAGWRDLPPTIIEEEPEEFSVLLGPEEQKDSIPNYPEPTFEEKREFMEKVEDLFKYIEDWKRANPNWEQEEREEDERER